MSSRPDVKFTAYFFALAGAAIAAGIRHELGPILGHAIPVVMFTVPVVLASLYGGFGPGLFCTFISAALSAYLFMEPYYSLGVANLIVLVIFIAIGVVISYFGQRMKGLRSHLSLQSERLEEANRELEQANQRKDEFLAMLAHELRNPLAGISTAAELLKFVRTDQTRVTQTGEMITRQVRHMTKLVDDLLDVSRVTRGLVIIEKKPVDVKDALLGAVEQVRTAIETKQQRLHVDVPKEYAMVNGDRTRLTQVISNLLANANRYSPQGGVIHARIVIDPNRIELSIDDNGQGIDVSLQQKIFDLFVQAERSIDRSQGGLGIGLALVKKITELHGGEVSVYSAGPDKGSRFTITLPRLDQAMSPEVRKTGLAQENLNAGRSLNILVVDDNRDAARSIAFLLQAHGHTVFVEHDAKTALDRAHSEELQVIISDIGLPDKDGRELCRQLKTVPHLANATFIAISGYGQATDMSMSIEAGFQQHLVKPVRMEALLEAIMMKTTG